MVAEFESISKRKDFIFYDYLKKNSTFNIYPFLPINMMLKIEKKYLTRKLFSEKQKATSKKWLFY